MCVFVVKVTLGSPCVFGALAVSDPILQTERHCRANSLAVTDVVHSLFSQTLQPPLLFQSGPCFADPSNFTLHGIHGIIHDQFDDLSSLSLKLPRNRSPSRDLSTIRQGYIFGTPRRLVTRLARFFGITRVERWPCGI